MVVNKKDERDLGIYVYDIETIASIFTYSAVNVHTNKVVQFVIHSDRNQLCELVEHIQQCKGMIGFNNVAFDYPVIHFILNKYEEWLEEDTAPTGVITEIYGEAQRVIEASNRKNGGFGATIRHWDVKVPQMDLFRIWHYNNQARSTSLKALEVSMNYPKVMDMPISHTKLDVRIKDIPLILEYNLNDVLATFRFFEETVKNDKIALRRSIINKYTLPCINWNNGKIGEELILKLYCDKTGKNPYEVKKLRSEYTHILLKDCIPEGVKLFTKPFLSVLEAFKQKIVKPEEMKDEKSKSKGKNKVSSIIYNGCKIDYGLGGVHGCTASGLYTSDHHYIIKSLDVASLYPWLPIIYQFYISHLGPEFLDVYKDNIVQVRLDEKKKPKHEQDKAIVDGFKEAANIPYGKSNDKNSFLYDPLYTLKTTVAGQLVTSMLCERLGAIPDCQVLMYNTDGMEVRIPRKHEDTYNQICSDWQAETGLVLEFVDYERMWIADVNNYGAMTTTGKVKNKGRFEVDKKIGNEPAYHKDNSFRVVPLAIQEYFVEGIPIDTTVRGHNNIYDFCGRQKFKGDDFGMTTSMDKNMVITNDKQQKVTRYYIGNKGAMFTKVYADGSREQIHKGYQVKIFNNYVEKNNFYDYDVNYGFYIREAMKDIDVIMDNQLSIKFG